MCGLGKGYRVRYVVAHPIHAEMRGASGKFEKTKSWRERDQQSQAHRIIVGKDKQVKRSKGRWPLVGYPMSGPNCGWGAEIQLADILRQKMGCLLAGSQRPVLHRAPHLLRYEKPVTRIGQPAVVPGTSPPLGVGWVPEAKRGHF